MLDYESFKKLLLEVLLYIPEDENDVVNVTEKHDSETYCFDDRIAIFDGVFDGLLCEEIAPELQLEYIQNLSHEELINWIRILQLDMLIVQGKILLEQELHRLYFSE